MRVLAYLHTFNDAGVIEQGLASVTRQMRQPDAIIIVDNASTDGTLDRPFPENVTIIRNGANLGTSGAVGIGFDYAARQGFDWIWVLDPDSVPDPAALNTLLTFYERLAAPQKQSVCFLACRIWTGPGRTRHDPMVFTETGGAMAPLEPDAGYSRCDCALWSGSLFRVAAIAKIGPPRAEYFIDWDELEYGYRARRLGYHGYMIHDAVLRQDVGRDSGIAPRRVRLGPFTFHLHDAQPLRCYYQCRNLIYFWAHEYRPRRLPQTARVIARSCLFTAGFMARPISRPHQAIACLRGIWDGITGNITRRY